MISKHILFDLDGTLIDSAPSILSGFALVLKKHGLEPRCELTQELIGPPLMKTLRRITGIDDRETIQDLAIDFKYYYDEIGYQQTREYPGITESLNTLRLAGASLFVVTNKRILPTVKIIKYLGWSKLFEGLYSQDAFNPHATSKSNVIKRVMAAHKMTRKNTAFVGDRNEDLEAAEANGIHFILAGWGYGAFKPEIDVARKVLTRPNEMSSLLSWDWPADV